MLNTWHRTNIMHGLNAFAGLAGERVRWESSISGYEGFLAALPGDALLAAAFLSYAGPFPSEFRDELVKGTWIPQVREWHQTVMVGVCVMTAAPYCLMWLRTDHGFRQLAASKGHVVG